VTTTTVVTVVTTQTTTTTNVGFSTNFVTGHNNTTNAAITTVVSNNTKPETTAVQAPAPMVLSQSESPIIPRSPSPEENVKVCNECLEFRNLVSEAYFSLQDIVG